MSFLRVSFIAILAWTTCVSHGQAFITEVNLNEIGKVKVRNFINENFPDPIGLNRVNASLPPNICSRDYHVHEKEYSFDRNCETVWKHYVDTDPGKGWSTGIISTELIYSKSSKSYSYSGDANDGLQVGQVLFLNLQFLFGEYDLAMAFEITSIDQSTSTLEFSYIDKNYTKGKQVIRFEKLDDNSTLIHHTSYYKSSSSFRDHFLYPFFHKMVINGFHKNMSRLMISE